jgi:hypothetical protein
MVNSPTHWTVTDEMELLEFLQDHISEGGDGVNFKTVTWTAVAKVVDENQTKGAPKNAIACKLVYIFFPSFLSSSTDCKGNLTDLRRILHLSLAKGNPK